MHLTASACLALGLGVRIWGPAYGTWGNNLSLPYINQLWMHLTSTFINPNQP